MTILIGCFFFTSCVMCCVHSMAYVIIPERCTEPLFAYPDDCKCYYVCLHGRPFRMPCAPGTHWNDRLKVCDWPRNAGCVEVPTIHPGQAIPTTEAPAPVDPLEPEKPSQPSKLPVEPPDQNTTDHSTESIDHMKMICYFTNAASREPVRYQPADIHSKLCTHIIYAFAISDPETFTVQPSDIWTDIDNKYYEGVTAFRENGVKVSIAVNGLIDSDSGAPNPILTDAKTRHNFVTSAVEFIEKYHFDGLELDLEYAACVNYVCAPRIVVEKPGFVPLIKELAAAFKPRGWLLSATVSSNQKIIKHAYDIPEMAALLDWISVITFDYHSSIDGQTGHNSPIYSDDSYNIDTTVDYFIKKGVPSRKLVLGISSYGQSFTLAEGNHDLNAQITGPGEPGPYSNVRGLLAFYEICRNTKRFGWSVVRDPKNQSGTYAYHGNQWVSYDDVDNIRAKAKYIRRMGLGGGMVWTLDFDDFTALCGCGYYPLLTALNHELRGIGAKPIDNCT